MSMSFRGVSTNNKTYTKKWDECNAKRAFLKKIDISFIVHFCLGKYC